MSAGRPPDGRRQGLGRDYTLLWIGGAVSAVGSTATLIATPLLVMSSGTPAEVGLVTSVVMAAGLLVSLPAGVWADRADQRRLLLVCDLGRVCTLSLLGAAVMTGHAQLLVITTVMGATAAMSSAFGIAEDPAVRQLVPVPQLPRALARNQARAAAAGLCGPPLGGVLFVVHPALPFAMSAAAFLFSFACIALIRTPTPPAEVVRESPVRTMLSGLRCVWRQPFLRATLIQISGLNLVSNALWVITIVIIDSAGGQESAGLVLSMGGVGSLLGAFLAPTLVQRLSVRTILIANRLIWAGALPLFLIIDHPIGLGLVFAVLFFIGPTGSTALVAAQMAHTTDQLQGRVGSARSFVTGLSAPAGTLIIGLLLDYAGRSPAIIGLCAAMLLLTVLAAASRALRDQPPTIRQG